VLEDAGDRIAHEKVCVRKQKSQSDVLDLNDNGVRRMENFRNTSKDTNSMGIEWRGARFSRESIGGFSLRRTSSTQILGIQLPLFNEAWSKYALAPLAAHHTKSLRTFKSRLIQILP
jgi:hypothetical protein